MYSLVEEEDPTYKVDVTKAEIGPKERQKLANLIEEYKDVFSRTKYDLGDAKVAPMSIKTTTEVPVASKYLKIPYGLKDDLRKQNEDMVKRGDNGIFWHSMGVMLGHGPQEGRNPKTMH